MGGLSVKKVVSCPKHVLSILVLWSDFRYYAPALGFLMFAVGVNSSEKDFLEAFKRPAAILAGYIGQFVVKPVLGYLFGVISVAVFGLLTPIGEIQTARP